MADEAAICRRSFGGFRLARLPKLYGFEIHMPPSWFLFGVIVLGGLMAVIGNTLYPLAREHKSEFRLATEAKAILQPEIDRNLKLAALMKAALNSNSISISRLNVTAWETISKGDLLLGLEPSEINTLLQTYGRIYRINDLNAQLRQADKDFNFANTNKDKFLELRQAIASELQNTVDELELTNSTMKKNIAGEN